MPFNGDKLGNSQLSDNLNPKVLAKASQKYRQRCRVDSLEHPINLLGNRNKCHCAIKRCDVKVFDYFH